MGFYEWRYANHPTKKYGRVALSNPITSDSPKIRWEKQIKAESNSKRIAKRIENERKQLKLF